MATYIEDMTREEIDALEPMQLVAMKEGKSYEQVFTEDDE